MTICSDFKPISDEKCCEILAYAIKHESINEPVFFAPHWAEDYEYARKTINLIYESKNRELFLKKLHELDEREWAHWADELEKKYSK